MVDRTAICAISVVLLCATAGHLRAAGFDCGKAASPIETTICSDSKLSKLDDDLATTYAAALASSGSPAWLRAQQRLWIAERNKCDPSGKSCLEQSYNKRLDTLRAQVASPMFSFRAFSDTAEDSTLWNFIAADARLGSQYSSGDLLRQRDRFSFARIGPDSFVLGAQGFYLVEPHHGTFTLLTKAWPADAVGPVKFLLGDGKLWALLHADQLTHGIWHQDFGALFVEQPGNADVAIKYVDIASFEGGDDGRCDSDDFPNMKMATHVSHFSIEKPANNSQTEVVILVTEQNCKTQVTTRRRRVFANTGSDFRELGAARR